MSFDDLFGLLLFVVFIALPALSRLAGSKKPGGGAAPGPGGPGRGVPPQGRMPTASTSRPAPPTTGGGPATTASAGDELERRLAEARERVRRALEGPGGSSSSPPAAQTRTAAPTPGPARAPAGPPPTTTVRRGAFVSSDRDDGLLSTPLDPSTVGMLGGRERAAARRTATRFDEAPALQVERPGSRTGPRTPRASAAFATDPETVRSAIIWHQVLGEPRARRPLGGRPSTLRSR